MNIRTILVLALGLLKFCLFGQNLPQYMLTDWNHAGPDTTLPSYDTLDVLAHGFVADGLTPNDGAMDYLLATATASPTVLFFPAGEYLFERPVHLTDGSVLKGASATETHLLFDLTEPSDCIRMQGQEGTDVAFVLHDLLKDSTALVVDNAALFHPGDFIKIYSEDAQFVTSDWAKYSAGQLCRISAILEDRLVIEQPLRRDYPLTEQPRVVRLEPVQFAGVECLTLLRRDTTSEQTANIKFGLAANCWVKGIRSQFCNFSHITIEQSTKVEVSGCYFQDAFSYGGGGKGYGVALQFTSGDCLVENNIFSHLRHSMLLQAGVNGNVLGYNYSQLPYWTETNLPTFAAGDLVLHGNYPYANLLEGNIVQNIVIDNSHGINGPHNCFFRNRAEFFGIFMNNDPASSSQLFVGNEVTSTLPYTGLFVLEGTGHYSYGNNIKGYVVPANTNELDIASLYVSPLPDSTADALGVGNIGLPNPINTGSIQAKDRFSVGDLTTCEPPDTVVINSTAPPMAKDEWLVFPNPATTVLYLTETEAGAVATITDLAGRPLRRIVIGATASVDVAALPSGMYILVVEQDGKRRQAVFVK